jgi:hypothetical protein
MGVNRDKPYIYILPEDDADNDLATGFAKGVVELQRQRQMQVLPVARGWKKVLSLFESVHIALMDANPNQYIVLVINFDGKEKYRRKKAEAVIPPRLTERVFVLGVLTEPEDLKRANLGSPETVGEALAKVCRREIDTIWEHPLLRHNASELDRLRQHVRLILFSPI